MFLLLPTRDTHAHVAEIGAVLLDRYWPGHPALHVLHHGKRPRITGAELHDCAPRAVRQGSRRESNSWLATVTGFLRGRGEDVFLLLLDDYALCAPARSDVIADAAGLMSRDSSVGLIPLCWYPAAQRIPRNDAAGFVTLRGAPILLQAAIWRRRWFLELAGMLDPRSSPWAFEADATQAAKRCPRQICAAAMPTPAWVGGRFIDGLDKSRWPLPYHNLMHRGRPDASHDGFLRHEGLAAPARGLGDTIASIARATGADALARAFEKRTGRDCGCERRRRWLNERLPY